MIKSDKLLMQLCAIIAFTAISIGAFTTHSFEDIMEAKKITSLKTGSYYALIHVVATLSLFKLENLLSKNSIQLIQNLFVLGTLLFSFSIFIFVFLDFYTVKIPFLFRLTTPLGGTFLLVSWALILIKSLKK